MTSPRRVFCVLMLTLLAGMPLRGQTGGFLLGSVRERSGSALPGAEVRLQDEATGARQTIYTDGQGHYESSELIGGTYKVTVRSPGFRTIHQTGIPIAAGRVRAVDFLADVLPLQQEMTVESGPADVEDANSGGLTVSRGSPQSRLPANGRDLHALYSIMPGAVTTSASLSDGGQFTVGGQRPNMNTFRIDGISGNNGLGLVVLAGSSPGATLPGMTTIGSTQSLVAKEETERVELRSFDFSAEGGERPGALIAVQTRPGTNDFHGSLFGYARPRFLDSPDWFAQSLGAALPSAALHGWGGSLGGPVWRKHTFFFASMEKARVQDTAYQLLALPTAAARSQVAPGYQAFLNAFPLPVGRALSSTEALGGSALRKNAQVANYSIRVDQSIGNKARFFGRYSNVPSSSTSIELGTANSAFGWFSATAGMSIATAKTSQEIRINFSQATSNSGHFNRYYSDSDLPAVEALNNALLSLPIRRYPDGGYVPLYGGGVVALSFGGVGQQISGQTGTSRQSQYEGADTLAVIAGRHSYRMGGDFVAFSPSRGLSTSTIAIASPGFDSLLARQPFSLSSYNSFDSAISYVNRGSAFGQDTFRVNERFSVEYGMRWEITPSVSPTYVRNNFGYLDSGTWLGTGNDVKPVGTTPVFVSRSVFLPSRYSQVVPRIGLAYRLKGSELVLRAGVGAFYDPAIGSAINPANFNPLQSWQYIAPVHITAATPAPPVVMQTLFLPKVWEWRTSLEKSFRAGSLLSLSYLGSSAQHLLRKEAQVSPETGVLQSMQTTSHAASSYHALLMQFRGNLTPSLYALLSYTWAHSMDIGSSDSGVFLVNPVYKDSIDRGSSNFDVRHAFSGSVGYRLPTPAVPKVGRFLKGWNLSSTVQARTGFPFDVTSLDRSVGLGFANTGRPDLVPGPSLWLHDASVPGGRTLNRSAFSPMVGDGSGTFGRNVLRGSGLMQVDASLRRQFHLYRESGVEFNLSAFNLFNQRSYASPVGYFGSPLFGQPTSAASLMLGSGNPTGGLTPIYQTGGPRTVEVGLKFQF